MQNQAIAGEGLIVLDGAVEGDMAVGYFFLDGLNANLKETWTHETNDGSGFFWPSQRLAHIPGRHVMTFGYNAASIDAIAQTLTSRLIDKRKGEHALCNTHSNRHARLENRKIREQKAIYDSVSGIGFIGTPHTGSIELQDLRNSFERPTIFTQHVINICTFFETKTIKFAGEEIVPRDMAILHYMNERKEPVAKEHAKMAKFTNAQNDLYQSICERLRDMGTDGLHIQRACQATYRILQIPSSVTRVHGAYFLSTCGTSRLEGKGRLGSPPNIPIHSLASRVGQSQAPKMATVSFVTVPCLLLDKKG
ncbi:hypothetical protein N657DRAFT_633694 [Parathielavia appendiculata]|uniref:Uncharacterized protein n=1 Tax=Parathielavia appendiculata TaxID=2587402 RepID=A0AAN6U1G2_9PEZI|nr:hypothetical protein N657DRAFT_633694 [Parathielavia appendiculata]